MFILTIDGKESEGAYSVQNEEGHQVLYLFEEEDDAIRYEDEMMIHLCESHGYEYSIITPNDIVIPPTIQTHDFI